MSLRRVGTFFYTLVGRLPTLSLTQVQFALVVLLSACAAPKQPSAAPPARRSVFVLLTRFSRDPYCYEWKYGGENRTELHVSRLTPRLAIVLAALGLAGSIALGTFLHRQTDASLPYLDATLSVFSLIAQWMMTRKILENWALWIILDVVYVWMFVVLKSLHFTAFQYAVFLLLAVLGLRDWKRSYDARASVAVA